LNVLSNVGDAVLDVYDHRQLPNRFPSAAMKWLERFSASVSETVLMADRSPYAWLP